MIVILVVPPFSTFSGAPPVALSALAPYLIARGVRVVLHDLNMGFLTYILECWDTLKGTLVDRLARRLASDSDPRLRQLLQISVPVVSHLKDAEPSRLLGLNIRALANASFLDGLFHDSDYLTATLSDVSAVLDCKRGDPILADFLSRYDWARADLIGFSLLSDFQLPYALLIVRALREAYPNLRFVAGGPYITEVLPKLLPSGKIFDYFDYLVSHEGESALLAILTGEEDRQPVNHPNVFSRSCHHDPRGPFYVEDIEALPLQDFTHFDLKPYRAWKLSLPFYSAKGCTWCKCAFCSLNHFIRYREREGIPAFITGIVDMIRMTGASDFHITDEDIPPARLSLLAHEVRYQASFPLSWAIQTRFIPNSSASC